MHAVWVAASSAMGWLLWLVGLLVIALAVVYAGCVAAEGCIRFTSTLIDLPEKPNPHLPRVPPG
jgi:hypothetical protein